MICIVGLGNPGTKYEDTRHNIGFKVIERLSEKLKATFENSDKFEAEIATATLTFEGRTGRTRLILAKPQTFMNSSGNAVAKIINFYKLRPEDQLWVVHDDLDVDLGTTKIRLNGSSAGQKGIASIMDRLGTDKFIRFRIGIRPKDDPATPNGASGRQPKPAEQFVLEKFHPDEKDVIAEEIEKVTETILEALDKGIVKTSL